MEQDRRSDRQRGRSSNILDIQHSKHRKKSSLLLQRYRNGMDSSQRMSRLLRAPPPSTPSRKSFQSNKPAEVEVQVTNNRIFVYKIIHDLRHPTEALSEGLKNILETLTSKKGGRNISMKKRQSQDTILQQLSKIQLLRYKKAARYLTKHLTGQESDQLGSEKQLDPDLSNTDKLDRSFISARASCQDLSRLPSERRSFDSSKKFPL